MTAELHLIRAAKIHNDGWKTGIRINLYSSKFEIFIWLRVVLITSSHFPYHAFCIDLPSSRRYPRIGLKSLAGRHPVFNLKFAIEVGDRYKYR